jgi:hypothetical protein
MAASSSPLHCLLGASSSLTCRLFSLSLLVIH